MRERAAAETTRAWERLESWCSGHHPRLLESLNPGAPAEELRRYEEDVGRNLPPEVWESFRMHEGQSRDAPTGLIFGLYLLPLSESLKQWEGWRDIDREYADDEDMHRFSRSHPEGAIQLRYSNLGWLPLTHDWGGNHLGVDLAPGPNGVAGQIITFGRDEDEKYVVAENWALFLNDVADELESGNYEVSDEGWLSPKEPPLHFHDFLKQCLR